MSTTRQITLTEHADGKWTAYDTATETVTQGTTRDEALDKLDDAATQKQGTPVNSDDPIFNPTTFSAGEPTDTSKRIDEVLYGSEDRDE